MNCKPGDFAVVVTGLRPNEILNLGTFLTVTRLCLNPVHMYSTPYWNYENASRPLLCGNGEIAECIRDECLKPIRPPKLELPAPPVPEELLV